MIYKKWKKDLIKSKKNSNHRPGRIPVLSDGSTPQKYEIKWVLPWYKRLCLCVKENIFICAIIIAAAAIARFLLLI